MRGRQPGFTLIELMMVVAIIGILSSVAIPNMKRLQLRSKQAERSMMVAAIQMATDDYFVRDGRYPTSAGGGSSMLTAAFNPAFPPQPHKRPFVVNQAGWNTLSLKVEGNLYYSYYAVSYFMLGSADPWRRYEYVYSFGDLDGTGEASGGGLGCYAYQLRNWTGTTVSSHTKYDVALVPGALYGCF